ncbi:MAG TPA: Gfo/Idh/MocA family oxidoreductase, partial [Caulobacteraceae bacterium]
MSPARTPLRVGVAGAGVMGRNHARVLSEMPITELAGVYDPNPEAAADAAAAFGGEAFSDFDAFVAAGFEAVVVAAPNRFHRSIGCALIESGAHVLVEKPIAPTVADAEALIEAARRTGRVLMVGHVERFNPAVEAVKKAIADDDIISIQITRVGPFPPRMGEVGVVIDLAVHDIDIIRHLTGDEIVAVQPQLARTHAEREDTALLQFRTAQGVIAQINTNWVTPFKARTLQVATRQKFVVADLITRTVTENFGYQRDGSYSTRMLNAWPHEPLRRELEAFVAAIRDGSPPPVTGEDGLRNLEVAL